MQIQLNNNSRLGLALDYLAGISHAEDSRVLAKMLDTQYQQFDKNIIGTSFVALLFLIVIKGALYNPTVWLWCLSQWGLEFIHYRQRKQFLGESPETRDYRRWFLRALVIMMLSGLLWGITPFAFSGLDPDVYGVVFGATAALLLSGGLALLNLPAGYIIFSLISMPLLVIAIFILDSSWALLALMTAFYIVMMLRFSLASNRSVADSISLGFKNQDLANQLEEAVIDKSKFLATASHDLRQPLHALTLLTSASEELGHADRETLVAMQKSIASLNELFASLLDISKLDSGIVEVNKETIVLSQLLDTVTSTFSEQIQNKGLRLILDYPQELLAQTDPLLCQRILMNLLSNALRYTHTGSIRISAEVSTDEALITIHDTGIGIAENQLSKVFGEFYQVDQHADRSQKGLGLGLAIVKRLSELLGHQITFASNLGVGTSVKLSLPLGRPEDLFPRSNSLTTEETDSTAAPKAGHVLIIEDIKDVSEAMEKLLHKWNYTACSVSTPEEAFTLPRDTFNSFDIIVSDYGLNHELTGLDVIAKLIQQHQKSIPAIIITGNSDHNVNQNILAAGYELLHKPVIPGRLRMALKTLVNQ